MDARLKAGLALAASGCLTLASGVGSLEPTYTLATGQQTNSWAVAKATGRQVIDVSPNYGWLKIVASACGFGMAAWAFVLINKAEEFEGVRLVTNQAMIEAETQQYQLLAQAELEAMKSVAEAKAQAKAQKKMVELSVKGQSAIPVQTEPVNEAPTVPPSRTKPTAFLTLLKSPFISRAIFGGQRTGKSYLAACVSLALYRLKGTKIFHINLCSYGDEDDDYWCHAKSVRCDLSSVDSKVATDKIQQAIALVIEWFENPNSLLIFDELAYTGSSSNAYVVLLEGLMHIVADKIATLTSAGAKRQRAIWTLAPEFTATTLVDDAKAVKKLNLCYVSVSPVKSIEWEGQTFTFDQGLYEQVARNYKDLTMPPVTADLAGCDRICFVDGEWMPVGVDKNTLIKYQTKTVEV